MSWSAEEIPEQRGRVAIVTGANSGLGLEAARQLARSGALVVMAVRDVAKGQSAANGISEGVPGTQLELRQLDLASLDSVRAFAAEVIDAHPAIDILLNNAGIMASPARETADGFESQVGVNHLAHFVLTAQLMPALSRAPAARVVTQTSFGRLTGRALTQEHTRLGPRYDPWRAYGDSKLANYQFGIELARRLGSAGSSVASLVAHPGLAHTNLQTTTLRESGGGIQERFWALAARWVGMEPEQATLSQLRAATDPAAQNGEFYGPRWFAFGPPVRKRVSRRSASPEATLRMWQVSEKATGTRFDLTSA